MQEKRAHVEMSFNPCSPTRLVGPDWSVSSAVTSGRCVSLVELDDARTRCKRSHHAARTAGPAPLAVRLCASARRDPAGAWRRAAPRPARGRRADGGAGGAAGRWYALADAVAAAGGFRSGARCRLPARLLGGDADGRGAGQRPRPGQPGRPDPGNRGPVGAGGRRADHSPDQRNPRRGDQRKRLGYPYRNLREAPGDPLSRRWHPP